MAQDPFRRSIKHRPGLVRNGQIAATLPKSLIERNAEEALIIEFTCHRKLFGDAYSGLQSDYFRSMPQRSGVFVRPLIPIGEIVPGATRPGDIDLLVVPYEGDQLILDRALAIEVKVVRASYARQGRSPNDFGISQASALMQLGFPQAALAHLIVSDASPAEAWRDAYRATVLDAQGRVGELAPVKIDLMPADLVARVYGRLSSICLFPDLGLASVYVRHKDEGLLPTKGTGVWNTECRPANRNPNVRREILEAIGNCFEASPQLWLDNPRFDPPQTSEREAKGKRKHNP